MDENTARTYINNMDTDLINGLLEPLIKGLDIDMDSIYKQTMQKIEDANAKDI